MSSVGSGGLSDDFRIDAEHYKPEYLKFEDVLAGHETKLWGELNGDFIVGPFGSAFTVDNYVESSGYRYIRGKDVKPFFLRDDNAYMPEGDFSRLKKYALHESDLLVSVVGTLGNVAIVDEFVGNAIFSCKSTAYRSRALDPYYLLAYLNSTVGQAFLQRRARGAVQTGLNLPDLQTLPIYLPSDKEQLSISRMVLTSWQKRNESQQLYQEAETMLLEALGLEALDLSPQLSNTASFEDAFSDNRLDAEHFQPKFYNTLEAIQKLNPKEMVPLGDLLSILTNGHTPTRHDLSEGDVIFLTAEHVLDFKLNLESDKRILKEHHETMLGRTKLRNGDVLITIKGRVGNVVVVEGLEQPTNINQDVALLRIKPGYHPFYVAGLLNSVVGKMLTEHASTGQINPFLSLTNLQRIPIPIFERERMDELGNTVKEKVKEARQAETEAKALLEQAKARVEALILGNEPL